MDILFVDDDPITLELMGQAARLLGYQAKLARSGKEAIRMAVEIQPSVIFLDMMMPDMDGLEVLKKLKSKSLTEKIPVIILSAGASLDDSLVCMQAGAQGYLFKPVPLQELMNTIKKYDDHQE